MKVIVPLALIILAGFVFWLLLDFQLKKKEKNKDYEKELNDAKERYLRACIDVERMRNGADPRGK